MVIAHNNAQQRHRAMTFLPRVETISEICEGTKIGAAQRQRELDRAAVACLAFK
jgi:hypothetical protein